MPGGRKMTKADEALVFQAAALVLTYPEAELLTRLDTIEAALARTEAAQPFSAVLAHLRRRTLSQLQSFHIQEFDLSRRHALHLSYWTDGDTRRRGEVLAEIKQVYRESGLLVATGGELPDYLPMVLEFAVADPERGVGLLQRFRASLELLRLGLAKDGLPHAGVLTAVCDCLPGESPRTHAEVQARYGEIRPVEFVGLDSVESLLQRSPASGAFGPGGQPAADGLSASPAGDPASPAGHPASPTGHPASPTRHPRGGGDLVTSSRGGS
jgi:nitrate reductase delta subunit